MVVEQVQKIGNVGDVTLLIAVFAFLDVVKIDGIFYLVTKLDKTDMLRKVSFKVIPFWPDLDLAFSETP